MADLNRFGMAGNMAIPPSSALPQGCTLNVPLNGNSANSLGTPTLVCPLPQLDALLNEAAGDLGLGSGVATGFGAYNGGLTSGGFGNLGPSNFGSGVANMLGNNFGSGILGFGGANFGSNSGGFGAGPGSAFGSNTGGFGGMLGFGGANFGSNSGGFDVNSYTGASNALTNLSTAVTATTNGDPVFSADANPTQLVISSVEAIEPIYNRVTLNKGGYNGRNTFTVVTAGRYRFTATLQLALPTYNVARTSVSAALSLSATVGDNASSQFLTLTSSPTAVTPQTVAVTVEGSYAAGSQISVVLGFAGATGPVQVNIVGGTFGGWLLTPTTNQLPSQGVTDSLEPQQYVGNGPTRIPLDFAIQPLDAQGGIMYDSNQRRFQVTKSGLYQVQAYVYLEVPMANRTGFIRAILGVRSTNSAGPNAISNPATITADPSIDVVQYISVVTQGYYQAGATFSIELVVEQVTPGLIFSIVGGDVTISRG